MANGSLARHAHNGPAEELLLCLCGRHHRITTYSLRRAHATTLHSTASTTYPWRRADPGGWTSPKSYTRLSFSEGLLGFDRPACCPPSQWIRPRMAGSRLLLHSMFVVYIWTAPPLCLSFQWDPPQRSYLQRVLPQSIKSFQASRLFCCALRVNISPLIDFHNTLVNKRETHLIIHAQYHIF